MDFQFQTPEPFELVSVLVSVDPGGLQPAMAFEDFIGEFQHQQIGCRARNDLQHLVDDFFLPAEAEMVGDDGECDSRGSATACVAMDQEATMLPQHATGERYGVPDMLTGRHQRRTVVEIDIIERQNEMGPPVVQPEHGHIAVGVLDGENGIEFMVPLYGSLHPENRNHGVGPFGFRAASTSSGVVRSRSSYS